MRMLREKSKTCRRQDKQEDHQLELRPGGRLILLLLLCGLLLSLCSCQLPQRSREPLTVQPQDALLGTIRIKAGDLLTRDIIPQLSQVFSLTPEEIKITLTGADSDLINPELNDFRRMEGMILPGEYEVTSGSLLQQLITQWITASEARMQRLQVDQPVLNRLTPSEQLILASIVEAECLAGRYQAEVAAVMQNRLADAAQLQSCVTVEYALGFQRFYLTNDDLGVISAYNTYQISGLPIGPICTVGDAALKAAIQPSVDAKLYFFFYDYLQNDMFFFADDEDFAAAASASQQQFIAAAKNSASAEINKQYLFR